MDEFDLIQRFFAREQAGRGVVTGVGDDGAVLHPETGYELINVIDTLVAGVHFPVDIDAADLGYRVVAVNLSDIAAMGGRPRWMTLALTIPESDEEWLRRFADGLYVAAGEFEVVLVGGDMTQGRDVVATVQITGDVESGKAIRRSGASVGDAIYVTGTLGDAAAGLELLSASGPDDVLARRFLRPQARVAYGRRLIDIASAAIDVSDGLLGDLGKLLAASDVGAEVDLGALPLSDALAASFDNDSQRRFALMGGDDYELCFTAARDSAPVDEELRVTRIGIVIEGTALICRDKGVIVEFDDSGYRHFR